MYWSQAFWAGYKYNIFIEWIKIYVINMGNPWICGIFTEIFSTALLSKYVHLLKFFSVNMHTCSVTKFWILFEINV